MKPFYTLIVAALLINCHVLGQDLQWASKLSVTKSTDLEKNLSSSGYNISYTHPLENIDGESIISNQDHAARDCLVAHFSTALRCNTIYIVGGDLDAQFLQISLLGKDMEKLEIMNPQSEIKQHPWGTVRCISFAQTDFPVESVILFPKSDQYDIGSTVESVGIASVIRATSIDFHPGINMDTNEPHDQIKPEFFSEKEKLSKIINSPYPEAKPVISPDGQCLYFVRRNCPTNFYGKKDDHDIYFSEFVDGSWSNSRNIGTPLNDKYANGVCSVSPDGNQLLVINAYTDKNRVYDGVSVSKRTKNGWSRPIEQKIEGFHNLCGYQDYTLSTTGDILLMALQLEESYGDQDLYVSFKTESNQWSKPVNLGAEINTPLAEFSPYISMDNHTLYFASTGHQGHGQSDIFCSYRLDESWQKWSTPENLGKEVNTKGWESYFTISPTTDYAYFISDGSTTNKVIYEVDDRDVYRIAIKENTRKPPVIIVSGRILNEKTESPIETNLVYYEEGNSDSKREIGIDPDNGSFNFSIPTGKCIHLEAKADGYFPYSIKEDFSDINNYSIFS